MPQILLPSPHLPSLSPLLQAQNIAGPKYRKPKMGPHDLRAWSFEDGCLCSILHGLLQLQIWTAFLLPARLFPTVARQSATQRFHTTFSQLSEPPNIFHLHTSVPISGSFLGSTLPFSLFGLYPHLHKRAVVAITPQTPPLPLMCGCSQLVRLGR